MILARMVSSSSPALIIRIMESFVRTSGFAGAGGLAGFATAGFEGTGFAGFGGDCAFSINDIVNNATNVLRLVIRLTSSQL